MTNKELKEYLTAIVDLEQNYYLQTKLREKLEDKLRNGLHYKNPGFRPTLLDYTVTPFIFPKRKVRKASLIAGPLLGALLTIIIGNILIVTGYQDLYYDIGIGKLFIVSIIVSIISVYFSVYCYIHIIIKAKHIRKEQRLLAESKRRLEEQQKAFDIEEKESKEYNRKIDIQCQIVRNEIYKLSAKIGETSGWLKVYYAKEILYPKYQNYVAVSTILDYLLSGRCSQLEGHEGAYNLYENESRLNAIIIKLEDIERAVNRVAGNQYLLAKSIENSNRRMENLFQSTCELAERMSSLESGMSAISDNLEQINELSAITAYNTERTAAEVRYRNIIDNVYTAL